MFVTRKSILACGAALALTWSATSGAASIPPSTSKTAAISASRFMPQSLATAMAGAMPLMPTGGCSNSGVAPIAVKNAVDAAVNAGGKLHNMILIVGNANGELYRYQAGYNHQSGNTATACDPIRILSGSKWLIGTLAMRMVQAGKISLDDKPSQYFTWWTTNPSDKRSQEKLKYLLAQDGGFDKGILINGCADNGLYTLQQCAQQIYNSGLSTDSGTLRTPGQVFDYGAQDLQLAAAMLEKAGGDTFANLFAQYVTGYVDPSTGQPIMPNTAFIDKISGAISANPYAAGGAVSTADDYAHLLRVMLKGNFVTDLNTFFAAQTLNPDGSDITSKFIPPSIAADGDWRYALGHWSVCHATPYTASGCAAYKVNASPGLYGWTPWIDRQNGYWALIATDTAADNLAGVNEGDTETVPLMKTLQPLIVSAL